MNIQFFFTQTIKNVFMTMLTFAIFNVVLLAQCTLVPKGQPIVLPTAVASCQSQTLTPQSFLDNLNTNCPDGVGVTFNLKIYAANGTTVIFDSNASAGGDAVGNNGNFPIVPVGALGIGGVERKVRIQRFVGGVGGQFVEANIIFQIKLTCSNRQLNANDDLSLNNPLIVPASNCTVPAGVLCIVENSTTAGDCTFPFYGAILRSIKTTNQSTDVCSQTITFNKININQITFPSNYTDATNKGCAFATADRHPSITGFPILDANNRPLGDATSAENVARDYANARITYSDVLQGSTCLGRRHYRRTWTIQDLCAANPNRTFVQDIISQDMQAPMISPIAAVTINAATNSCNALNFQIPTASITENCTLQSVTATITNAATALNTTNGGTIATLARGVYNIRYTATDACGNASTTDVALTVQDNTAPSITCSGKIVALNNMGQGTTSALYFIDQLNDNCGASTSMVEIKRMNQPNTAYASTLTTTCADVNNPFMVILRAADVNGNQNFCMTTVEVQDKLAPSFVQMPDITVNCIVDSAAIKAINPVVGDGCTFTLTRQIKNWTIENCQTGTFDVCYTAKDAVGNTSTMCRKVTVINPTPLSAANVTRPKDIVIKNFNGPISNLEPAKLDTGAYAPAVPKINYNGCDLAAVNHQDNIFKVNGSDCCFKILRTWKIASCCMMNAANNGPKIIDEFTQVIKVEDNLPPLIKGLQDTLRVGTINCLANVKLPSPVSIADCPGNLPNSIIKTTTTMPNKVNELTYNNVPSGTYVVTYSATDACGNIGTTSMIVIVKDTTKPVLVAHHGLSANLDSNTGELMLSAKAFANAVGTTDNCTPFNKLKFAFSKDTNDVDIMFDCNSFIGQCDDDVLAFPIALWARDEAGNWSMVTTYIAVSKVNTPCSCQKNIAGAILTSKGDKLSNVFISVTSNNQTIVKPFTTNANGAFVIPNIISGQNYTITPKKVDGVTNGVSTADLVLISKHILGQQSFNTPYQWIAADVNKNGTISTADLVELRKLILGINSTYTNNNSWRFVDKSYTFSNTTTPLKEVFPEAKNVTGSNNKTDFIAIKIGDVNSTAIVGNAGGESGTRSDDALEFMVNDMKLAADNTYEVVFKTKNLDNVAGYQFTLNFDKDNLEFISLKDNDNGADAAFGFTHLDKGVITTSWMNATNIAFKPMETVFTIKFKAKNGVFLSEMLKITSDFTKAEAYTQQGEAMNVALGFMATTPTTNVAEEKFALYQNQPNPFKGNTTVGFYLPTASRATLTVIDQTGRLITSIDDDFNMGRNEIKLEIPAAGLYFYRLDTPEFSATRRMMVIE
jgi:Cohesin domain/Dockerin type I domain